MFNRMWEFVG